MHDDCCEGQAFDQAYDDVTEDNRVHDVLQVNAKSHLRTETHEEAPSENSASTANDGQARQDDQCRQEFWRKNELHRLYRHGPESVDLFGYHHAANLGGKCGPRATAHGNRRQQWSQFPREADGHQVNYKLHRSETPEFRSALHREDKSSANG